MPDTLFDFLSENIARPPLHKWLAPELVSIDDATGAVTLRLPFRDEFRRSPDRPEYHGGIIATLADMAGHAVVAAKLRHSVPTIDLRIDYLRMAAGPFLLATGTPVKLGRTIGVVDVQIRDEAGRLVAVGRGAFSTREG